MVYLVPFLGAAALLSNIVLAVPTPGSGSSSTTTSSSVSSSSSSSSSDCGDSGCGSFGGLSSSSSSNNNNNSNNYGNSGSGSSGSSYGSNDSQYSQDNSYESSSTSSYTSTSTAYNSYNTPSYGSGSNYNNYGSGYDDCVSQCIAQFGNSAYTYTPTSTSDSSSESSYSSGSSYGSSSSDSSSSSGSSSSSDSSSGGDSGSVGTNGVTHTVIVAPTQGVFRYVPFAVNASVGDTVEFRWGANTHTVRHSSELFPCNSTEDQPFTSGVQQEGFVYHQAVNSTDPLFFSCGVATHCQKGMFGIINPPVDFNAPTSVGNMMESMMATNDDIKAYALITASKVGDLGPGATWGNAISIGNMSADVQAQVMDNVLFTRNVLAMNAGTIWNNQTNAIDLSALSNGTSLMLPPDVGAALAQADVSSTAASSSSASVVGATDAPSTTPSASTTPKPGSGAGALASPKMLVAFVAVVATVMAF